MRYTHYLVVLLSLISIYACSSTDFSKKEKYFQITTVVEQEEAEQKQYIEVARDINLGTYYDFMDEVVAYFDALLPYPIDEHLIVRSNPWLIDTLVETDYYRRMARGIFTYDPQAVTVLRKGTKLLIPDSLQVDSLLEMQGLIYVDVNIPEFKLRIWHYDSLLYTFPVRVGQNTTRYLGVVEREVDLRTQTGTGCIVRHNRNPDFVNPRNNKEYKVTRRDDERVTLLPRIPWIEPELNGIRYGQLIHPTTNPNTLGKAYSNGCIGVREGDMWVIYYHAPLGANVYVRYDREIVNEAGEKILLKDIYPGFEEENAKRAWKYKHEVCVCSDIN